MTGTARAGSTPGTKLPAVGVATCSTCRTGGGADFSAGGDSTKLGGSARGSGVVFIAFAGGAFAAGAFAAGASGARAYCSRRCGLLATTICTHVSSDLYGTDCRPAGSGGRSLVP